MSKERNFVKKYNTFSAQVLRYTTLDGSIDIDIPALDEVRGYPIEHRFWDIGALTHPDEPWAVDEATRNGIEAYLKMSRCEEELGRISREAFQMIKWAITMRDRVKALDDSKLFFFDLWYLCVAHLHIEIHFVQTNGRPTRFIRGEYELDDSLGGFKKIAKTR